MLLLVVALTVMLIGGFGASSIARSKNRDGAPWFVAGLFFPLPAILVACFVEPAMVIALGLSGGASGRRRGAGPAACRLRDGRGRRRARWPSRAARGVRGS